MVSDDERNDFALEGDHRIQELQTLKIIAETLNQANDLTSMLQSVLKELLKVTGLTTGWIFLIDEKGEYMLAADDSLPLGLQWENKKPMCEGACWCIDKFKSGRLQRAANIMECKRLENVVAQKWGDTACITHHATVPLIAGEERFGLLNVAAPNKTHFTGEELALLEAVSFQIGTAVKRIKLTDNEQQMALVGERNRLARDLHDSVIQLLFSLMLTVRGTKEMTTEPEVAGMLDYIQDLSKEALQEMRALIWQLRPQGLEDGVANALFSYGKVLGMDIEFEVLGVLDLPTKIEEALWRIGQEALNNCKKHANTKSAKIELSVKKNQVSIKIEDNGSGFHFEECEAIPSVGLSSMKERTELLGGTFEISSTIGVGTTITSTIPFSKK